MPNAVRERPARHHTHEVSTVLGAAVNVGVHAVRRDGHAFDRLRGEALLERLLERLDAEHAVRAGAGHRNTDLRATLGHEHADKGEARRRVLELLVGCFLRNREADLGDDLVAYLVDAAAGSRAWKSTTGSDQRSPR